MRNKIYLLILVALSLFIFTADWASAEWVDCQFSASIQCSENMDNGVCTGDVNDKSRDCPYGGVCLLMYEKYCTSGEYCGDVLRVDCYDPPPVGYCGDGGLDPGEQCDLGGGNGSCPSTCDSACQDQTCGGGYCGDGNVNGGEQCDLGGGNGLCPSLCSTSCTDNTCGGGGYCGDGNVDGGEQCDNGGSNGGCPAACSGSCTNNSCGPTSGSISVNFTNANVTSWTIPGAGSGSGNATMTGLSFGTYTISLGTLAGFTCTPDAWSKGIDSGSPDATFNVTCTANPALTGTITAISSPRNTVLTSSGQSSGTISGTISGGSGTGYTATVAIRRTSDCNDWAAAGWTPCYAPVPGGYVTVNGATWSVSGAGVPAINNMTNGSTYQVFFYATDSTGAMSAWISTPQILFDTGAPSGTITTIPNPTDTRLTSTGWPNGTIAGTATDTLSNVTSIQLVIRERNPGGVDGVCDAFDRDWNANTGAWVTECTAPALLLPFTPSLNVNWSYSSMPPTSQMTADRTYIVYLNIIDAAGNSSVWNPRTSILYSPNSPPAAESVTVREPDYCTAGPSATISWTYTDPDDPPPATTQSAYQVMVDDDIGFASPSFDSGKILSSSSEYIRSGLAWNTTYYSRVKVWDDTDTPSAWSTLSICSGPGCIGQTSWLTPQHAYPLDVNTFSWTPVTPPINQEVTFSDGSTTCYSSGGIPVACSSWLWSFGDSGSSTAQAPTHTYTQPSSYNVDLTVTDAQGYACSVTKILRVQQKIPGWREVLPK